MRYNILLKDSLMLVMMHKNPSHPISKAGKDIIFINTLV